MRSNIVLDDVNSGETRAFGLDWTPYLADGDSISGEPAAPVIVYGAVTPGENTVSGAVQTFAVTATTVGPWALALEVTTANGETLREIVCSVTR